MSLLSRSIITATVLYDANSVVDISKIEHKLFFSNGTSTEIMVRENSDEVIYLLIEAPAMSIGLKTNFLLIRRHFTRRRTKCCFGS